MNKETPKLDWTAQLVMLRGMTQHFGSLHDAQALQLRGWPFTVDPGLENSVAKVDFDNKKVEFVWTGSNMKIDKKYQFRLKTLGDSVKFLLGDDWSMSVVRDGALIFPIAKDTNNGQRSGQSNRRGNSKKRTKRAGKAGRSKKRRAQG